MKTQSKHHTTPPLSWKPHSPEDIVGPASKIARKLLAKASKVKNNGRKMIEDCRLPIGGSSRSAANWGKFTPGWLKSAFFNRQSPIIPMPMVPCLLSFYSQP